MFAAPPEITATPFARIPDSYSRANDASPWVSLQVRGAVTPNFLEGPAFDAKGNLWVTDIPWGRLFRITPDGTVSLGGEYDGWPNGMKFLGDGSAIIACHKYGLMRFHPDSGQIEPFLTSPGAGTFKGCNDLCIAQNGDIYFTDQGQTGLQDPTGRLYRLRTNGSLECLLDSIPSPNGLVLNADESILFLAVTRANAIWKVALHPDGSVGKVSTYIPMSGGTGPDGIAMDEAGNLVVCHVGLGSVWLFSPLGEPLLRIRAPESHHTTNCAYGGPDNRTLFITESTTGTVLTAEMPAPGRRL